MKILTALNSTNSFKKLLKQMISSNYMRKTNIQILRANKKCKKPFLIKQSKYKTTVKYQEHTKTDTLIVIKFKDKHI